MAELKPIVALYKTYRGGEWLGASLESIYRHCTGIVAVTSDQPWRKSNHTGNNFLPENCISTLESFQKVHPDCKVSILRPGVRQDTEEQYRTGLAYIRSAYGRKYGVLIIDTDEIWEYKDLAHLRRVMATDPKSLYYRSAIWTYLKSPLYRVTPQEKARPVIGLASPDLITGKSRFSNLSQLVANFRIRDVQSHMHHFGYVRLDQSEIIDKLANTSGQDGVKIRASWKQTVWDNIPYGSNLHPARGFEHCWGGAEEVCHSKLPRAVVESGTFWTTLMYHTNLSQKNLLLDDNTDWRTETEQDESGITTTVTPGSAECLMVMLGISSLQDCRFLEPRLRMSFREVAQLAKHAKEVPEGGTVLEIGSGMGGSLAVIGSCAPRSASLVAIDPFEPYDEENVVLSKGVSVGTVEEFWETLNHLSMPATLLNTSSRSARIGWDKGSIDLLLVDGNHSYEYAKYDIEAWWPLLKPGGILLVHDVSGRFPGVVRAVREFEASTGLKFNLPVYSSLAWLKKPLDRR